MDSKWLGLIDYNEALTLQNKYHEAVSKMEQPSVILGLEHKPVVSLGLRAKKNIDVLWSDQELKVNSIQVVKSKRGGEATLHTPGQLVIYPILNLETLNLGVKDLVCLLIKTTKAVLLNYGIKSFEKEGQPGLFTEKGKICFIGLKITQKTSFHGLAINLNNDLNLFNSIKSCGVQNETFDAVSNYSSVELKGFFEEWMVEFKLQINNVEASFPLGKH